MTAIIRLQREPIDVAGEVRKLTGGRTDIGAVVTFTGICRADENGAPIAALTLEHYPGMAEAEIARHLDEARARWPLLAALVDPPPRPHSARRGHRAGGDRVKPSPAGVRGGRVSDGLSENSGAILEAGRSGRRNRLDRGQVDRRCSSRTLVGAAAATRRREIIAFYQSPSGTDRLLRRSSRLDRDDRFMKRSERYGSGAVMMNSLRRLLPVKHGTAGGSLATLTIGALGVVYGDIGTSPLYAMDQLFFGRSEASRAPADVIGGVSLVIWTITVIVAIKYALLVLRAQNDGEGGVFALYGLLHDSKKRSTTLLLWALMLGAGLLFGDGMITPAISVLSAVEGLQVATPGLASLIVPVTVGLLTVLFLIQFKGASRIGVVFGPILAVWFVAIAVLGARQIAVHPEILAAFNPLYGLQFLHRAGLFDTLLILGALMLVVTGGEAMYADVGHFG